MQIFRTLVWPLCITLTLWGLTGVYWRSEERESAAKRALALGQAADNAHALLRQQLLRFELILRGAQGFYEGSEFVTGEEFKRYVETLHLDSAVGGLQGIAIALRVDLADKERHTADMRRRGVSPYLIKPEGVRSQYTPIVLIEPLDTANARALGFDIATNPVAHQALEKSLVTGEGVITGRLTLAQDAGQDRPAAVMYLPLRVDGDTRVIGWVPFA
jgi:CHASE1-domain containing sensor protein